MTLTSANGSSAVKKLFTNVAAYLPLASRKSPSSPMISLVFSVMKFVPFLVPWKGSIDPAGARIARRVGKAIPFASPHNLVSAIGRVFLLPGASGPVRLKGRTGSSSPRGLAAAPGISGDSATISPGLGAVAASASDQVDCLPDRLGCRVLFLSRGMTARAFEAPTPRARAFSLEAQMANPRKPSRLQDTMEFRSMWSSGAPIEDIADKHGLTRSTVNRQASRFGYPNRGKKNNLLGSMPTTLAVDDPAHNVPEVIEVAAQSHPRWPVAYDTLILKTGGKYSSMAELTKTIGRSVNAILARWHQLRPM